MGHVGVFIWQHWLFISPAEPTLKGGGSAGRVFWWCSIRICLDGRLVAGWVVFWQVGRRQHSGCKSILSKELDSKMNGDSCLARKLHTLILYEDGTDTTW